MKTKRKLTEETAKRYCTAAKKQKTKIIDEFIATTSYNRKYAIHMLKNGAYVTVHHFNNVAKKSVHVITKTRKKQKLNKFAKILSALFNAEFASQTSLYCMSFLVSLRNDSNSSSLDFL